MNDESDKLDMENFKNILIKKIFLEYFILQIKKCDDKRVLILIKNKENKSKILLLNL
jgi:hypothetical protein